MNSCECPASSMEVLRMISLFEGGDAQLDAAIKHLLDKIVKEPVPVPPPPEFPDKSFDYPVTE